MIHKNRIYPLIDINIKCENHMAFLYLLENMNLF